MSVIATPKSHSTEDTLNRLLRKVASVKAGATSESNIPPTSHPTGSAEDGTVTPPKGPTATEHKSVVAEAAQSNPVDGSKLTEGNGDKEHGITRMLSDEKANITPKPCSDDAMAKKMASLTTKELIAKSAALTTPVAAQMLVAAASQAASPAPVAPAVTPEVKTAADTAAKLDKAAQEGAARAEQIAREFATTTVKEACFAADLLAHFTKKSINEQTAQIKEAARKKAEVGLPPMPPGGGGPVPPVPPPTPGGEMPPSPVPGDAPPGPGGDAAPPSPMGGGDADGSGGHMSEEQIEQLLMALLEQQGNADPKALEESGDPAAQAIGKAARAFLKQGKFQLRAVKNAKERVAIDHMKQFIRETSR